MTMRMAAPRPATAIWAATLLASVPLVLGFLAGRHPAFDSLGHFRAHLAVGVAAGGLALLGSRYRRQGLMALLLGVGAFWTTLSAFTPFAPMSAAAGNRERPVYRLLQLNLRFDNPTPERVLSLIGRTRPDVITFEEVSDAWKPRLEQLSAMYPYRIVCSAPYRIGGNAILSRRPFSGQGMSGCRNRGSLALAEVDFGGRKAQVGGLHLDWPWPFRQGRQLDQLRPIFSAFGDTALLAGDLNASTWSATVRRVEADAGLTHVGGIGPSWLDRRLPDALRPYVGLPIDQVFSRGEVEILSARTLESVGSDHLPVLVAFSFTGTAGSQDGPATATALADGGLLENR
jgi:endonuclease/exonuclease/phosphatase (EEP) superfamily protein YafD